MASPNFVPRANSEGSIGTTLKKWLSGYFGTVTADTGNIADVNATTVDAEDVNATTVDATTVTATGNVNGKCLIASNGAGSYVKLPELTTEQRDALTTAEGMMIHNITTSRNEHFENGAWADVTQASASMDPVTAALIFG